MSEDRSEAVDTETIRLERSVDTAREELWLWFTASEKTAQWIGPWHFTDKERGRIGLQLVAEEGAPASAATIWRCEPPSLLELTTEDAAGSWHLRVSLAESGVRGEATRLVFEHFEVPVAMISDIRAGWNYYLDLMLAAKDGLETPVFEDYLEAPAEEA
ncbi:MULTISPECIES: SRPBCC domain-containing protein [unclassified Pseudoclavibacter]|uniref:SRPBCC domain-containing protein n=1 Tax=unclassified Pseudoclavibacter TaxID=2615177 RepID=UPI0012F1E704|nr:MULTISPECIES: SRPBCC domain-containing protein [unclassified Pseudoclavibacter]MBF4458615.1 SRPBCC domain-containing protein [Pseudoclavibacter sp. VKM Ac-2867]VXB13575.1 ATPase [Pseudoclavibacter sp. 8L]